MTLNSSPAPTPPNSYGARFGLGEAAAERKSRAEFRMKASSGPERGDAKALTDDAAVIEPVALRVQMFS